MFRSKTFRCALFLLLVNFIFFPKISNEIEQNNFAESIDKTQTTFKRYQKAKTLDPYVISPEARHQLPIYSAHNPLKLDDKAISEMVSVNLTSSRTERIYMEQCIDNRIINCSPDSRYRNIDGSCNNLEKPNCGRIFSRLERFVKPDYANGIDTPRMGCNGLLPGSRVISLIVHSLQNDNQGSEVGTELLMNFGQWIDHDIAFTTQFSMDVENPSIQCCPESPDNHPECRPIRIPENDPVFPTRCMNFVRSVPYPGYSFGWRDQMNSLTAALDCSQVYGSTDELARWLRTLDGTGQLKSTSSEIAGELLPFTEDQATSQCIQEYPAFIAGDVRVNQNPVLTCLHTIYLRFHNRIAKELKYLNPCWDDEKIYQETRRIVIACHQRIIYTEFLPLIIGDDLMDEFDLDDESTRYKNEEYPRIWNEFQSAAYRLHTLVPNVIKMASESKEITLELFANHYFNTRLIHTGRLDDLIRGATIQQHDGFDRIFSDSVTKYLYTENITVLGLDLAAVNIQRGRDHGLRGFTYFAEKAYGKKINNFEDLHGIIRESYINILKKAYHCVSDIDFYTGIFCEVPYDDDALVGLTAANIIAKQFYDLKFGDRYFYSHKKVMGSFTKDQMKTIKNINLATLICYTTNIQRIKIYPLKFRSSTIKCSHIHTINLLSWKECHRK